MGQILLAYGLPKETFAAITMLYRNTKLEVHFPDGDTDYFDSVAGVLQGDTLAPYLFSICLDYMLRTSIDLMKETSFELAEERSRRYPVQTITDADYADDIALLENTPAEAETLLHSLERPAGSIGFEVNVDKTEYMFLSKRWHLHTKTWAFETSGQVHLPRKQCLINRKKNHQRGTSNGMDNYR